MNRLNFSTNWNGKLNCNCYTTIRKLSPGYTVGKVFDVYLVDEFLHQANLVSKTIISINEITDPMAYVDTGYNAAETKGIFRKMYATIDLQTQPFLLMVFQKLNVDLKQNIVKKPTPEAPRLF